MGTSSSYKGSTSKVASRLRDGVDSWASSQSGSSRPTSIPANVIAQAAKLSSFPKSGSGGGGVSSKGGKQSAPRRNARVYASTVSRAAGLARAFRDGDQAALERAGLDFAKLSSMSRADMVRAILAVVFEAQTSSDIPTEEQRDIAGGLLDWMLDTDLNPAVPSPAATAGHAIGLIIAEIFLSESGEFTSQNGLTREQFVDRVYDAAQSLAGSSNVTDQNVSQNAIDKAIENGLRVLRRLYPEG